MISFEQNKKKNGRTKKISIGQQKIFQDEANYWLQKLGMVGWEADYWCNMDYNTWDDEAYSMVRFEGDSRIVVFWINPNWPARDLTDYKIRRCAFHEVQELLLGSLRELALCRFATEESITQATHAIIRTLENTFFKEDYNKRFKRKVKG